MPGSLLGGFTGSGILHKGPDPGRRFYKFILPAPALASSKNARLQLSNRDSVLLDG